MDYLISGGLVLTTIAFAWLAAKIRRTEKKWAKEMEYEEKCRRDGLSRLDERYWDLRHEVESGFESIGLERKSARPATGPSWVKKQD